MPRAIVPVFSAVLYLGIGAACGGPGESDDLPDGGGPLPNHAPSFTPGPDVTVLEDSVAYGDRWATDVVSEPGTERGQVVTFSVTDVSNSALFAAGPSIAPDGTLTFTPTPDAFGSATVSVVARDDGGTEDGGSDASETVTFTITVEPVNDAPVFAVGADQQVLEGAGAATIEGWATELASGPANESAQALHFEIVGNSNAELFETAVAVSPEGTLTWEARADAWGSATIDVRLVDDGGAESASTIRSTLVTAIGVGIPSGIA